MDAVFDAMDREDINCSYSIIIYTKRNEDGSDDPILEENGITQNRPQKIIKMKVMKKKYLYGMLTMLMVAFAGLCFTACGDDDDGGNSSTVSGLYYYESGGGSRTAYNFVNGNTVDIYGAMSSDPNAKWCGERGEAFPLRSGWYYWSGNKHTYSYHIAGDMVVIGTDRVMTISGNTLIYDDMGVVLYKWN